MRCFVPLLVSLIVVATVRAQDDVLAVERRTDKRGHAICVQQLHKVRVSLVAEELTPKELCRYLSTATGNELSFHCSTADSEAAPALSCNLRGTTLWSLMSIAQIETGLRFVYRFGVVFLVQPDAIKPLTELKIYDLRAATAPLTSFPGPDLGLGLSRGERPLFPEPVVTDQTISGFTADGVEQLLRESIRPDSWDLDGVTLSNNNGLFLIRQTPQAHDEIELLLVKLGVKSPSRAFVRRHLRRVPSRRVRR